MSASAMPMANEDVFTLDLTPRALNSLLRGGFTTIAAIRAAEDRDLLDVRHLGPTLLTEIRRVVGRKPGDEIRREDGSYQLRLVERVGLEAGPFAIAFVQPAAPTAAQTAPAERVRQSTARSDRSLICRIAAAERWAREENRTKATAAARAGLEARFAREVDPDGVLPPDELARRVKSAKTAYYTRLARSRRQKAA